jgi:hypothetical protein
VTRRTRLLLFALPGALVATMLAAWVLWPRTAITRENAAKIQPGMTLAEVEAILGGPARDEAMGPLVLDQNGARPDAEAMLDELHFVLGRLGSPPLLQWQSNQVAIVLQFDAAGRVTECHTLPLCRGDESPLDRLRRWLGL